MDTQEVTQILWDFSEGFQKPSSIENAINLSKILCFFEENDDGSFNFNQVEEDLRDFFAEKSVAFSLDFMIALHNISQK